MPGTLRRLNGNTWEQHWVLGDDLADDVRRLFSVGDEAATREPELYWSTVHNLAKQTTNVGVSLTATKRRKIMNWRPSPELPANPADVISLFVLDFGTMLRKSVSAEMENQYRRSLVDIQSVLPDVLSRIQSTQSTAPKTM